MKRLIVFFTIIILLMSACKADISDNAEIIEGALSNYNFNDYTVKFRVNMQFYEDMATLLFAQGTYSAQIGEDTVVTAEMTQTVLNVPASVKIEYFNGLEKTIISDEVYENETTDEEFFGRMIYSGVTVFEEKHIKKLTKSTAGNGDLYFLELKNADEVLIALLDENIYELAAILKPQKNLINFKNAKASYVVTQTEKGSYISAQNIEFTVFLYDTPPYNPAGKTEKLEDYTLELKITLAMEFFEN